MAEGNSRDRDEGVPRTGVNDHAWEREHKHPTAAQMRATGHRRRDAETKLEQHLAEARRKAEQIHDNPED